MNIKEAKKAFRWVLREMDRNDCNAKPIRVEPNSLAMDMDSTSIFYDYEIEKSLMRQDWLGDTKGVSYYIVVNYNEISKTAPELMEQLLENGIKLYHDFADPNGGITKRIAR